MGTLPCVFHALIALLLINVSSSYRLNVPRVLLPYHPKTPVNFMLEVKGGCFTWRSTRPDVVSVEPIQPDSSGCSDRAIITSKSKYEEEQNSVIFAENFAAGVSLSCGVTVDVVERIAITTTTKILFVDAAPAKMVVEAYNKEGDKFSTLGAIPFDWFFNSVDNPRAIRIIPFAQSKYDAPEQIMKLEKEKQKGYVVLVEGALTGSATLSAKFSEPLFSKVQANSIDLMVVANVLLVPSHDLYLPIHSIVHYRAQVIKQKSIEDIPLPSSQYSLALSDPSICDLDDYTSKVTAKAFGRTEVTLVDSHMKGKLGVKPQSSHIYVVDPDVISFSIDRGNNWYLQKGVDYKINVRLLDAFGNPMHIPDNALFHTTLSDEHFDIIEQSRNGSYFHVTAKKPGTLTIRSSLVSIQDEFGAEHPFATTISADQELQITDKLEAHPYIVVFPYQTNKPYTYQLRATGGTGSYSWQSNNPRVATVDETRGKLISGEIGESIIRVEDVYNSQHFALVHVYILEPAELHFGESHVEAELEKELTLNVLLHGLNPTTQKLMPFTDCRHIPFTVGVDDLTIFRHLRDVPSEIPSYGRGCATVTLKALSIGDTKAKVQFNHFTDAIDISAFPPLVLSTKYQLLLATSSEILVDLQGGPRPWMMDSSKYFTKADPQNKKYVKVFGESVNSYKLQCSKQVGDVDIVVSVGNHKSKTNPLPVISQATITVCCALPDRIALNTLHPAAKSGLPACPSFVHSVFYGYPSVLLLTAYGRCSNEIDAEERMFDSLTSVKAKYDVDNEKLLTVKLSDELHKEPNKLTASAIPSGKSGTAKISATATVGGDQKLHTSLTLNLVGIATAKPTSIVLWNAPDVRGFVHLYGGSGHFWLESNEVSQYINAQVQHIRDNDSEVLLSPISQGSTKLSVYDLCIEGARLDINVKVTDVNKVKIVGSDLVEMNALTPLRIQVLDIDDQPFSSHDVKMMDLDVVSQLDYVRLTPVNLLEHHARGVSVGTSSIIATVKSSTGNVVRSAPHLIQVFSPLRLLPEVVTLIPEAVFQFEILGGPVPAPELYFNMTKSGIVDINSIGLIKSAKLIGETTVTAIVTNGKSKDIISQDTAIVRVVSLTGIRLILSSNIVEEGDIISAHIEGLDQDENPFSFGGAEYPFNVVWKISATEVLAFDSLLTDVVEQENHNRFGARFIAHKNGKVNVDVVVKIHPQSTKHFSSRKQEFTDSQQIIVQEALRLSSPRKASESILITPSTTLDLTANRPNQQVTFKALRTNLISVIGDNQNILLSGSLEGSVPLRLQHQTSAFNETTFITVDVMQVKSIHLSLEMPIVSSLASTTIPTLPQGIKIRIRVQFRDQRGRLFNAANNDLKYRPHRFDLTDIVALENNRTFDIVLKQAGETVFRVWDTVNPRLSAFIRLPVGDVIGPAERSLFVGDVVCFSSPVKVGPANVFGLTWGTSGHSNNVINFINRNNGNSVMVSPGEASVYVKLGHEVQNANATTFSTIKIQQPSSLRFVNSPKFVSNIKSRAFVFPVQFGSILNDSSRNIYGCDNTADLAAFSGIRPPFDCISSISGGVANIAAINLFTTRAVFDPSVGSYACVLTDQIFELKSHQINDFENSQLHVSAQWNDDSNVKSSVSVPFYPRYVVHDEELLLNNLENEHALLKLSAVKALQNHMRLETCHPNILSVEKVSAKGKDKVGNLHYRVTLNVHSAALWTDKADGCVITIKNSLTDQSESVPVKIKLYGDATKLAINAFRYQGLFGWIRNLIDTIWPFISSLFLLFISSVLLYLGYQRGIQKTGDQNDATMYHKGLSPNGSLNYSGLKPLYTSTPDENKFASTGVAAKFKSNSSLHHRNISNQLFEDDSLNVSRHSAGSGNDSYLNGSNRSSLQNLYYKR
uniref:Nuclear pore membrane glycoprotein 210 n=1 Tax=Panagrolaimus superbus TaxID=310955 RepID=A0A914ZAI0_9BILA